MIYHNGEREKKYNRKAQEIEAMIEKVLYI